MSEKNSSVRAERDGPVTTVILDRPHARNAVDRPTADALAAAFLAFEMDDTAKMAVLWGANGVFCAGADLKAVATGKGNRVTKIDPNAFDPLAIDGPMGPTRMRLSKPVIAAVAGPAVAGGLELACWCDLRVVEEDATFGVYCRRWGVPLIDGGTVRLPRLIGQSRALDMILTGRGVGAMEAFAMGLANRVVPKGQSARGSGKACRGDRTLPADVPAWGSEIRIRTIRPRLRSRHGERVQHRRQDFGEWQIPQRRGALRFRQGPRRQL